MVLRSERSYYGIEVTYRFLGNFTGNKFREICVFRTVLGPISGKNYCELLIQEMCEILDDSLNKEV